MYCLLRQTWTNCPPTPFSTAKGLNVLVAPSAVDARPAAATTPKYLTKLPLPKQQPWAWRFWRNRSDGRNAQEKPMDRMVMRYGIALPLLFKNKKSATSRGIVLPGAYSAPYLCCCGSGEASLPRLSARVRHRTNNESLILVTTSDKSKTCRKESLISSILHTDENSHLEPVRYSSVDRASGWLLLPHSTAAVPAARMGKIFKDWLSTPYPTWKVLFVDDGWPRRTSTLLFMQHLDSTARPRAPGLTISVDKGKP